MAKFEFRRLSPQFIAEDKKTYEGLKSLIGFTPSKPECSFASVESIFRGMLAKQAAETEADVASMTARDIANAQEWAFHNLILMVKDQVIAQYGDDSMEIQMIGLKRKSEYKRPSRFGDKPDGEVK